MRGKNIILSLSALLFGVGVVSISAYHTSQLRVMAETEEAKDTEVVKLLNNNPKETTDGAQVKEATQTAQVEQGNDKVDYYLPYPGILPDHPLYWLKMIRDKLFLMISQGEVAKYNRLLLYADKRIGAAKVLVEGGKAELGVTTASKGEKYLEEAVNVFLSIQDPGKATPEEKSRLSKAVDKHEEVLLGVLDKVPDQKKNIIQELLTKIKINREKLK